MRELNKGDLIISNDLLGFVTDILPDTATLNTEIGVRTIRLHDNIAVLATAQELAASYANHIMKGMRSN